MPKPAFRNPFTPSENDVFTPQEYLAKELEFARWNAQNPIVHELSCMENTRREVMFYGMCCFQHLQRCVERRLFSLAGCKAGVFIEPEGYQKWLVLAQERLDELQKGQDSLIEWTRRLEEDGPVLNDWIWNHGDDFDQNTRPGFTLNSFVVACQKYDFKPDFKDIALAFGFTESEVKACWDNPKIYDKGEF